MYYGIYNNGTDVTFPSIMVKNQSSCECKVITKFCKPDAVPRKAQVDSIKWVEYVKDLRNKVSLS